MNPWKRAVEAEHRALVAEERATFLEREIDWMRHQVEGSRQAEVVALKIAANVGYQQAFGMVPFPEASAIPPREETVRETESLFDIPRSRDAAISAFKLAEIERFKAQPA